MTTDNSNCSSTPKPTAPQYAAFIGIDWASQEHALCLQTPTDARSEHRTLQQTPAAISSWINELRQRFAGQPVAIAIELARGPLIYALMGHEFIHLYPINPKSLARFRQSFRPSGAKDDQNDAQLLCRFLRSYPEQLRCWKPDDVATRALGRFNEIRRDWVDELTALSLRWRSGLAAYYPLFLELFAGQLDTPLACRFLQRWPNLATLQKASPQNLRSFFYKHGSRSEEKIQQRLELIARAKPLTEDEGVVVPGQADALIISKLLLVLLEQIAQLEKEIAERFAAHPDAFIFESLPGAGPVLAPRLLAAFGTDRSKFPEPSSLQQLSGVAPITIASGNSRSVHHRFAAPRFLRQTFWEFAKCSLLYCAWAKAVVDRLQEKGKKFNAAVRVVAFKWMRIIWRLWQNKESYLEDKYLAALERKGSPFFVKPMTEQTPGQ